MTETKHEVYLYANRNEDEMRRLNFQHDLMMKFMDGKLLHSSIPVARNMKIADVGTGTGIWLKDVSAKLAEEFPGANPPGQFDGFDISTAQFPPEEDNGFKWIQHNMLQPFPKEYHNLYDVVHVRFMAVAFKQTDYKTAVNNLVEIVKPGGYLQWVEADLRYMTCEPSFKACAEVMKIIVEFQNAMGMSTEASIDILAAFKEASFSDIDRQAFFPKVIPPGIKDALQTWAIRGTKLSIEPAIRRLNLAKSEEDIRKMTYELTAGVDKEFSEGAVTQMPLVMIIGQKA